MQQTIQSLYDLLVSRGELDLTTSPASYRVKGKNVHFELDNGKICAIIINGRKKQLGKER